jgi:hypothetical protein
VSPGSPRGTRQLFDACGSQAGGGRRREATGLSINEYLMHGLDVCCLDGVVVGASARRVEGLGFDSRRGHTFESVDVHLYDTMV